MVDIYYNIEDIPGYDLKLTEEIREVIARRYVSQREIAQARKEAVDWKTRFPLDQ